MRQCKRTRRMSTQPTLPSQPSIISNVGQCPCAPHAYDSVKFPTDIVFHKDPGFSYSNGRFRNTSGNNITASVSYNVEWSDSSDDGIRQVWDKCGIVRWHGPPCPACRRPRACPTTSPKSSMSIRRTTSSSWFIKTRELRWISQPPIWRL